MNTDQAIRVIQQTWGTAQFDNDYWEVQDWTIRDRVGYAAAGTNEIIYFAVPQGQNDPVLGVTKRGEHTNMGQANQIGGTDFFVLTKIRCVMWNYPRVRQTGTAVATDTSFSARQLLYSRFINNLGAQGVFQYRIMNKDWIIKDQPWMTFAQGFGLGRVIPPALSAVNGGANWYAGPSPYDMWELGDTFSLGDPQVLAPSTPFTCKIGFPLANSPACSAIYGASSDQAATFLTGVDLQGFKIRPLQ